MPIRLKSTRRDWLPLFLAALFPALFWAQPSAISFKNYTTEDGLYDNDCRDFCADSAGFVWIYSKGSISRFDGFRFKNYPIPWKDFDLTHLQLDAAGRIWATNGEILWRYEARRDTFLPVALPENPDQGVRLSFLNRTDSVLWLHRCRVLWKIVASSDVPIEVRGDLRCIERAYGFVDSKLRLWLGDCDDYIGLVDLENGGPPKKIPYPFHCSHRFFEDKKGDVWTGSWSSGLIRLDPDSLKATPHLFSDVGKDDFNRFFDILEFPELTGDSILWMSQNSERAAVYAFNWRRQIFAKKYPFESHNPNTLPVSDALWRLRHDPKNGILWAGGEKGMGQMNARRQRIFHHILAEPFAGFGSEIGGCRVAAPFPQTFEESRFLTNDTDVIRWDFEKKVLVRQPYGSFGWRKKDFYLVVSAARDAGWRLWVLTGTGLFLMDEKKWAVVKKIKLSCINGRDGLRGMVADQFGKLYVGHSGGVLQFDPATGKETSLIDKRCRSLFFEDGKIWAGTGDGFFWFDPATGEQRFYDFDWRKIDREMKHESSQFAFHGFAPDGKGGVWAGCTWGLFHVDLATGDYWHRGLEGGKPGYVQGLAMDQFGKVWVATFLSGVFRYDPETDHFQHFGKKDGLFSDKAFDIERIGDRIFVHDRMSVFDEIDPSKFLEKQRPLPVFIDAVRVLGKRIPFDRDSAARFPLRLRYAQNQVEFEFTAIDFEQPHRVVFEYKLAGFDPDWVRAAPGIRAATYTNLEGGNYCFRVRAINGDGILSEREAVFQLSVSPPFYRTWWFFGLCAAAMGGLFFGVFRWRENVRLGQFRLRERISQDLHDDLGSTLNAIALQSDNAGATDPEKMRESLEIIGAEAREVSVKVRDLVWTLRPESGKMPEIISRMRAFAEPILETKSIDCQWFIEPEAEKLELEIEARRHFFLFFKEAVNNLVKHSGASEARISLSFFGKKIRLEIADNGLGFDPENVRRGSGLNNLEARAAALGGRFFVETTAGGGSRVGLVF